MGVRLPESTLSGWFKPVCELLSPLYSELVKLVTGSGYVQVDETTVRVINKGKGKTDKEYLWMVRAAMENWSSSIMMTVPDPDRQSEIY